MWGEIKGEVARQYIGSSSVEQKELLLRKLFSEYSPEKWKKCCEHVRTIEGNYSEEDGIMDSNVIISMCSSDSDSSSSSSSNNSSDSSGRGSETDDDRRSRKKRGDCTVIRT